MRAFELAIPGQKILYFVEYLLNAQIFGAA